MPTYVYLCEVSNEEFEEFHSIKTILQECNICKEKNLEPHVPKRLIASATPGTVELTGHELKAKIKADTIKMKQEMYSNENKMANFVGEKRYQSNVSQAEKYRRR